MSKSKRARAANDATTDKHIQDAIRILKASGWCESSDVAEHFAGNVNEANKHLDVPGVSHVAIYDSSKRSLTRLIHRDDAMKVADAIKPPEVKIRELADRHAAEIAELKAMIADISGQLKKL